MTPRTPQNAAVDGMTRAEAEVFLKGVVQKFGFDLSDVSNLESFEHIDTDTGRGVRVSGGTPYVRAYRTTNGHPTWLPEEQWHQVYSKKKVVDLHRQRSGVDRQVLTATPLFTLEPSLDRLKEIKENTKMCPVCDRPMNVKIFRYRFAGKSGRRLNALDHHILSRHKNSDFAGEVRESMDVEEEARRGRALAQALAGVLLAKQDEKEEKA